MEQLGPYLLIEELARGGMGVVHRARDQRSGAEVALKLLAPEGNETQLRRSSRELEAVARLDHPHVVQVFESGVIAGRPFLAMELVSGPSLQERLARQGPLAPAVAADLVRKLALAVQHAHERGVLHRDLKPANVLLRPAGEPLLVDFGLSCQVDADSLTHDGQMMGTPGYAAPELLAGERDALGTATDIYGLGAILYAALTGLPPVRGDTLPQVVSATVERPPVPPGQLQSGVPPRLEAIVLRCLEKEPGARPPSAGALSDELERWLRGEGEDERPARGRSGPVVAAAVLLLGAAAAALLIASGTPPAAAPPTLAPPRSSVPTPTAEALLASGDERGERGDARGAILDYTRALELDPRLIQAWLHRGDRRMDLKQYNSALEDYARVLDLDPRSAQAHYGRAMVLIRRKDAAGALTDLDRVVALDPGYAHGWLYRGVLRSGQPDPSGALADLGRAIELASAPGDAGAPKRPRGYSREEVIPAALVARARLIVRQGKREEARADLERCLELETSDAEIWNTAGLLLGELGDGKRALLALERAVALKPQEAAYLINRGLRQPDPQRALADYGRALELEPTGQTAAIAYLNRGSLRRDVLKDLPGAIEDYEAGARAAPKDVRLIFQRGVAWRLLGDRERARADFERARAMVAPGSTEAAHVRRELELLQR